MQIIHSVTGFCGAHLAS
jgi:hypothetical protein